MKKLKILYVDVPFVDFQGGDKNRSRFLYDSLSEKYETDILLVLDKDYEKESIDNHCKKNKVFTLKTKKQSFYKPQALYNFSFKQWTRLKSALRLYWEQRD